MISALVDGKAVAKDSCIIVCTSTLITRNTFVQKLNKLDRILNPASYVSYFTSNIS